ncbi:MAG: hypothetical protein V4751_11025 [Pseudomonadota bacterium]
MSKVLTSIGLIGTLVYGIVLYVLIQGRIGTVIALPLNELGDFLAGAFGPLAIFWLILGFFQQGIELRQNTAALNLQARELKNSVEQQQALVDVSRNQFQAELEAINYERGLQRRLQQPNLLFTNKTATHRRDLHEYQIHFMNAGNSATNLTTSLNRAVRVLTPQIVPNCPRDHAITVALQYDGAVPADNSILTFDYLDALGIPGQIQYELRHDHQGEFPGISLHRVQN